MVRSHTQELLSGPRLRNACDRCHAQKLRCLKAQLGDTCVRCSKFGSSCVYSVRTMRRSIRKNPTNVSSNPIPMAVVSQRIESSIGEPKTPVSEDPTCLADSWLDPSILFQQMPIDIPNCAILGAGGHTNVPFIPDQQGSRATKTSPPQNTLGPETPFSLADLNSKLIDHYGNLSSILQVAPPSGLGHRIIAIDQTFTLTRKFIDMTKRFSVRRADQSTVLLFLSCYHRLVDIYESVFKKMQICTQNPHAVIPAGVTLNMPATQAGSYAVAELLKIVDAVEAPMTAYGTHFMLLLLLCTKSCEELRDAIASKHTQSRGDNDIWGPYSTSTTQSLFHRDVYIVEKSADKDRFDDSLKLALWNRWTGLATQIQSTKQAAMVFAVACL